MKELLAALQGFALGLGGPGLFVVAFLDSSLLSLPEINDLLIVYLVTEYPHRFVYYATMSTAGSVAGCSLLYTIGRKGGEALLRRRFHERHVDRALELYRRFGWVAIVVPALLPPPAPFKIFVLLAGVSGMPVARFALAVGGGRGLRYFGEGLLAVWYGKQTIAFLHANARIVFMVLGAALVAGGVAYFCWSRRRRRLVDSPARGPL
ncbi:MAG TPA: VTT domain-containing protein [Vicinamibacterales bacterium]|nr:VTT domain-containing protein [Vicinamibacterales bacterium]